MDLKAVIETRATVRNFTTDDVPEAHLREMVRLAGLAPSVNNSQPWRFIAIKNRELLKCMADKVRVKIDASLPVCEDETERKAKAQVEWFSTFFGDAPAVIAILTHPYEAIVDKALPHSTLTHEDINCMRNFPDVQSIGACIENLHLAACDLGYGTCWLSGPLVAREDLEECLGVRNPWKLAAMVAIGKPFSTTKQSPKKTFDEIFEMRA